MLVGILLMLLQAISELLKDILRLNGIAIGPKDGSDPDAAPGEAAS